VFTVEGLGKELLAGVESEAAGVAHASDLDVGGIAGGAMRSG